MILITGASGIVGEAIFNKFAAIYEVRGLAHTKNRKNMICVDLTDPSSVKQIFEKQQIDAVIHCAANIPARFKGPDSEIYIKNIQMAVNILTNITNRIRFINISTTSLYKLDKNGPLDEDTEINCGTFYQLSKKHIEGILHLFYKGTKNLLNIRISSPYSVNRTSDTVLYRFIKSASENNRIELWGSGGRTQSFTNVDSLASAVLQLFNGEANGDFNYVTTSGISMSELAEKIKRHKKDVRIQRTDKIDPEENNRTSINTSKIAAYVNIEDALDGDIRSIMKRIPL